VSRPTGPESLCGGVLSVGIRRARGRCVSPVDERALVDPRETGEKVAGTLHVGPVGLGNPEQATLRGGCRQRGGGGSPIWSVEHLVERGSRWVLHLGKLPPVACSARWLAAIVTAPTSPGVLSQRDPLPKSSPEGGRGRLLAGVTETSFPGDSPGRPEDRLGNPSRAKDAGELDRVCRSRSFHGRARSVITLW